MNTTGNYTRYRSKTLIAVAVSVVLAACAAAPLKSTGAADARAKLTVLQSDVNLATRAPVAIKEAEAAVVAAEASQTDEEEAVHLAYLADRKVEIAKAEAETQFSEDQRVKLSEQRDTIRLDARTHEADVAKSEAVVAKSEAALALAETDAVRSSAEQQTAELQRQIDELQARPTDRGLVLTLGDVLFTTGMADLKVGATNSLDKLAAFLNHYPDRSALIEGHTDNAGSDDYNQGLSQRRADSVKSYLMGQGIASTRLAATGKGESHPLAGNDSAAGRQQNRRVEVIIDSPPVAVVTSDLARE